MEVSWIHAQRLSVITQKFGLPTDPYRLRSRRLTGAVWCLDWVRETLCTSYPFCVVVKPYMPKGWLVTSVDFCHLPGFTTYPIDFVSAAGPESSLHQWMPESVIWDVVERAVCPLWSVCSPFLSGPYLWWDTFPLFVRAVFFRVPVVVLDVLHISMACSFSAGECRHDGT